MGWRKAVAVAVPLAVLFLALGFIVGLEAQRGPNWRLELDAYIADHRAPSEMVTVEAVTRARSPWNFTSDMGVAEGDAGLDRTFPPQAVRCALLVRMWPSGRGAEVASVRQVVFLARHSDALYHVEWVAYEGPQEPFGPELRAHLALLGCDLGLR